MSEARLIELGPIADGAALDLVLIGANDPRRCCATPRSAARRGITFVADPSQQLAFADGPFIRRLIEGADYLFTNEYEAHLTEQKTGWSEADIDAQVTTRVITKGKDGAVIMTRGEEPIEVPIALEARRADPTGVGDAFRAGFLTGLSAGLDHRRCAEIGSLLATYVLETVGTQEYTLDKRAFLDRLARAYGDDSAADVEPHITCSGPDRTTVTVPFPPVEPPPSQWELGRRADPRRRPRRCRRRPRARHGARRLPAGLSPWVSARTAGDHSGWWSPEPRGCSSPAASASAAR